MATEDHECKYEYDQIFINMIKLYAILLMPMKMKLSFNEYKISSQWWQRQKFGHFLSK